ncbi:MAG: hypothetical protein ABI342_06295 [Nitrososphaera sp.]
MSKHTIEKIISNINNVVECYEKLHTYEKNGCTYDDIKKDLKTLHRSTIQLITFMANLKKEDAKIPGLSTLQNIFKITYLPVLKIHLLYLDRIKERDSDLLKIQARLAMTYLNVDDCVDNLRIIRASLK